MIDCCLYFLGQIKKNGIWIDIASSKVLSEVNIQIVIWIQNNGWCETRIQQRKIAEDRIVGRKVPNCC